MSRIEMKKVNVEDIYLLRRDILRPGKQLDSVHFDGDFDADTIHLGLFCEGRLIGCATLTARQNERFVEERQFQLRGMAIDQPLQRMGYGRALLRYAQYISLGRNVDRIWLNAREDAIDFYAKEGYDTMGEIFFIADVCNHIVMTKKIHYHLCDKEQCSQDCAHCQSKEVDE